jgi:hypothetical protein
MVGRTDEHRSAGSRDVIQHTLDAVHRVCSVGLSVKSARVHQRQVAFRPKRRPPVRTHRDGQRRFAPDMETCVVAHHTWCDACAVHIVVAVPPSRELTQNVTQYTNMPSALEVHGMP